MEASVASPLIVERVHTRDLDPKSFFQRYVSRRCPVIISALIDDPAYNITSLGDLSFLNREAGSCQVKVEKRSGLEGKYGKGNEESMGFAAFLDKISEGDSNLYMTTQDLVYDVEGRPSIVSPPLDALAGKYPIVPIICGNLITSNINLWIGSTNAPKDGDTNPKGRENVKNFSSSGLHHDYHDNLYMLLRGEKKFRLFPPSEAENMYTVGELSKLHHNGRINYRGGHVTNADGSDPSAVAALEAAIRLEAVSRRLADKDRRSESQNSRASTFPSNGTRASGESKTVNALSDSPSQSTGSQSEDALEDELDAALENVLDAEIAADDDYSVGSSEVEDEDPEDYEEEGEISSIKHVGKMWEKEAMAREHADCNALSGKCGDMDDKTVKYLSSVKMRQVDIKAQQNPSKELDSGVLRKFFGVDSMDRKRQRLSAEDQVVEASIKLHSERERDISEIPAGSAAKESLPANFSRVDSSLPKHVLAERFPKYLAALNRYYPAGNTAQLEMEENPLSLSSSDGDNKQQQNGFAVHLKAGEMLFLPAGWFHEVFSSSGAGDAASSSPSAGGHQHGGEAPAGSSINYNSNSSSNCVAPYHCALNYWFHPPDNEEFDRPYKSDFWKRDFLARGLGI